MTKHATAKMEAFTEFAGEVEDTETIERPASDPNADLIQFYFRDIRPISSLLTLADEQSLADAVQQGRIARAKLRRAQAVSSDERARLESLIATADSARQKLIIANTRLVV